MYRFTRIANGPDKNGYHHPYFLRGREDLTRHILRLPRDATGLPRTDRVPSLPPRNQHPLRSNTTNQANSAFLDNLLSSRTNPVLPNNSIVNLDLASRYSPPTLTTTDAFQSSRINPMAPNTTHNNSSNLLSTYMPPGNPTSSTDSSILERSLLSSALNLNPAIAAALNPMPVFPNNSIVSLDLASRYLPPMISTTDPFQSVRVNSVVPNTTHNSLNLLSTYTPPGGAVVTNPTASTHSPIVNRLLLSSAMNPYPDVAAAAAAADVLNPTIHDWITAANLMLSQPRMPTEYNPMLVLPPQQQQQQPTLDLTNIDRVTLARWIAHQQEQELALALLQQRRQP
jgi:hypothetical protein